MIRTVPDMSVFYGRNDRHGDSCMCLSCAEFTLEIFSRDPVALVLRAASWVNLWDALTADEHYTRTFADARSILLHAAHELEAA